VNDKDLEMLEFPKIREMVAGFTAFPVSRTLAQQLLPSSNHDLISQQLRQSAEARHLLSLQPDFAIGEASDVRETAHVAARGKLLEPASLVEVRSTLAASRHLRLGIHKLAEDLPLLWAIAEHIIELPDLEAAIGRSVSAKGEVLDSASTWLSDLRSQLKDARQQLLDRLQSIIKSPQGQRCLQDTFITEREGRYVIPLKIESRKEIKGIVHDMSNTEATAFVEPWATVELGNDLRELAAEERREVERILSDLAAEVGAWRTAITDNVNLMAELDLALAKARYAQQSRVPLTVEIGGDHRALVVTGPNAGGKTVALKTIGLLAIMAQAGLPIPASERTALPVFDGIFADIGDEQSIEQTLSTFSWHMSNIVRILGASGEGSLVLLDELGTSTDPREGAALAQALLLHLLSRGTMVVATTHYSELKGFAHATPGMQNASLDFDPVTLAPTYHLNMGIPGGSNALAIASQLGLPLEIIDAARGRLGEGTRDIEALLADLQEEKQRIETLREDLERERGAAEDTKGHWERELAKLKEQEQKRLRETMDQLAEETADLQKEIRRTASELKKARSREKLAQAEKTLSTAHTQIGNLSSQLEASRASTTDEGAEPVRIGIGDSVWLADMKMWGTVLSLKEEDQVEVQVGHTKLITGLWTIDRTKQPGAEASPTPLTLKRQPAKPTSMELDLRGKRAEQAGIELDRYLNDASLAHLRQVRIIHGFGTGAVRQIVRDTLSSHPLVKSFRSGEREEGGDGVTVAML
jgi:DNA mismatch repair protein MutS2